MPGYPPRPPGLPGLPRSRPQKQQGPRGLCTGGRRERWSREMLRAQAQRPGRAGSSREQPAQLSPRLLKRNEVALMNSYFFLQSTYHSLKLHIYLGTYLLVMGCAISPPKDTEVLTPQCL